MSGVQVLGEEWQAAGAKCEDDAWQLLVQVMCS